MYHKPVMLNECLDGLNINPDGTYIDATFGGGGHSREILKRLIGGRLIAFDQDADAMKNSITIENEFGDNRFTFVHHNFRYAKQFLRYHSINKVDGVLADLGVSSHQFDVAERGFSFRFEGDLDMRMNRESDFSAKDVVNKYAHGQLATILRKYGELNTASKIATSIIKAREIKPIETTQQLLEIVQPLIKSKRKDNSKENQQLAQIFQAIRIEVNRELEVLKELVLLTAEIIKPGGRLVVMTYHSLEDRIIKNYLKQGVFEGQAEKDLYGNSKVPFNIVNKKIITASEEEIFVNNRARSAKLRVAEKL